MHLERHTGIENGVKEARSDIPLNLDKVDLNTPVQIIRDKNTLEEAKKAVRNKTLWLVPNWDCNRRNNPCQICFATNIMEHARENGYQHASDNFFEKLALLSQLPFKEVVITGGEPTQDLEILKHTLSSINSERFVRIITNGDWTLKKNTERTIPGKEEVLEAITTSKRRVRIEISAHDPEFTFKRKIDAIKERVNVGAQLRIEENENHDRILYYIINEWIFLEEHHALDMGNASNKRLSRGYSQSIDIKKLAKYTAGKNAGIYLISGKEGTRIIANHEAPYLVYPTDADICGPKDSAYEILKKTVNYFTNPQNEVDETSFIIAAFKAGQPIYELGVENPALGSGKARQETYMQYIERRNKVRQTSRKIMSSYYETIAEKSKIPVNKIKETIAHAIAARMLDLSSKTNTENCSISRKAILESIAHDIPHDPSLLASQISQEIIKIDSKNTNFIGRKNMTFVSAGPITEFMSRLRFLRDGERLLEHFIVLGLTFKDVLAQAELIHPELKAIHKRTRLTDHYPYNI